MSIRSLVAAAAATMLVAVLAAPAASGAKAGSPLDRIDHIVVVYQENHSFDNLYGGWEGVDGLATADAAHTVQVNQAGVPYTCLKQNDSHLTAPPLSVTCADSTTATPFVSHFANGPFSIDDYIPANANTCDAAAPGGCTRDIVHRFYQEQYQLDGGRQDHYTTGSDAVGLTQGTYDTRGLPIYRYLHGDGHPHYAIADRFFQAAFGGSFLNHQWLIAGATPIYANADQSGGTKDLHSRVDGNGMPIKYDLYAPTGPVKDAPLTAKCDGLGRPGLLCGDYAVNTIQPTFPPYSSPGAAKLPPLTNPTIGDRMSAAGVDWAWYSGGWSNADGRIGAPGWTNGDGPSCSDPATASSASFPSCPNKLFQYHHQPFNYFATYATGTAARAQHLRDEQEFLDLTAGSSDSCGLKPVSFIKPVGAENEHPGYASEAHGSGHLVELLQAVEDSRCAKDTMVIVTYDEFGGQWDHVPPPGQAGGPAGPSDQHGPGTRIPALVMAPRLHGNAVLDDTEHDTTSIMATIEHRFGVPPIAPDSRDARVADLGSVFSAKQIPDEATDGG